MGKAFTFFIFSQLQTHRNDKPFGDEAERGKKKKAQAVQVLRPGSWGDGER